MRDALVAFSGNYGSFGGTPDNGIAVTKVPVSSPATSIAPSKEVEACISTSERIRLETRLRMLQDQDISTAKIETLSALSESSIGIFDKLDALRSDARGVQDLIQAISCHGEYPLGQKLALRLGALLEAYQEDYEGRALSADSVRGFMMVLSGISGWKLPSITATPAGELYVQWRHGKTHLLSLQFLPTSEVRYVIFQPNLKHPERMDTTSGLTTVDAVIEFVSSLRVEYWVKE